MKKDNQIYLIKKFDYHLKSFVKLIICYNMFYWKYSDQFHYQEEIKDLLKVGVLEEDPESYYELLLKAQEYEIDVKDILNDNTLYETWFSSHLLCLSYLVGEAKKDYSDDITFYGSGNKEGIPEELGIKIFFKRGC